MARNVTRFQSKTGKSFAGKNLSESFFCFGNELSLTKLLVLTQGKKKTQKKNTKPMQDELALFYYIIF